MYINYGYQLVQKMSDISQDHWSADWLIDHEFKLYEFVFKNKPLNIPYGNEFLTKDTILKLRILSYRCNDGWIIAEEEIPKGIPTFLKVEGDHEDLCVIPVSLFDAIYDFKIRDIYWHPL